MPAPLPFLRDALSAYLGGALKVALLEHVGATPWLIARLASMGTDSPAGTSPFGESVSAASEVSGTGYAAGGLTVTASVSLVGNVAVLSVTSGDLLWPNLTTPTIRGAVLYSATREAGGQSSVIDVLRFAEARDRTAEPLQLLWPSPGLTQFIPEQT